MRNFIILLLVAQLSGCAGLFVAGAATTVQLVTDTRSTKEIWQDNNIELEIAALGNKAPFSGQARVVANSFNGTVVLMGQAPDPAISQQFEDKVRELEGVEVVHNQIRQKETLDIKGMSNDTWITTKVKSALLAEAELNGVKVKVITEDGEVFLFGLVTAEQGAKATEIARNTSGVKQVIRGFTYGTAE